MIDLTAQAGFPLLLDPGTLEVITPGEISFIRETRTNRRFAGHPS
jgi:hypothetical protein